MEEMRELAGADLTESVWDAGFEIHIYEKDKEGPSLAHMNMKGWVRPAGVIKAMKAFIRDAEKAIKKHGDKNLVFRTLS
jgi:hypothetical protein